MPFKKGDVNINRKGRPLTPEHKLERVLQVLEDVAFHPAKELVSLYRTTQNDNLKKQILVILLDYTEGKKKTVEDTEAPQTIDTSKKNAEKAHELLQQLEDETQKKQA